MKERIGEKDRRKKEILVLNSLTAKACLLCGAHLIGMLSFLNFFVWNVVVEIIGRPTFPAFRVSYIFYLNAGYFN